MKFLLIWLGFALVTSIAASAKNRSGGLGFVLGLLFGPFALIGYLISSSVDIPSTTVTSSEPVTETAANLSRFCTSCGAALPDDARFCPGCGDKVQDADVTNDPDIIQPGSEVDKAIRGDYD